MGVVERARRTRSNQGVPIFVVEEVVDQRWMVDGGQGRGRDYLSQLFISFAFHFSRNLVLSNAHV